MLSQVNKNDKDSLNRYKDLLRHRLRKYGYRFLAYAPRFDGKICIRRDKKDVKQGFRITEIESGRVVAGQDFSLSLKQVEDFWLEEYIRRRRQRELRGVHRYGY